MQLNKVIFTFLTILGALLSKGHANEFFIEARDSYFYPTNSTVREIYGGNGLYNLEFDAKIWHQLFLWSAIGIFQGSGTTLGSGDHTKLTFVPINIGLKAIFRPIDIVRPYLGLGPQLTYTQVKTHSNFLIQSNNSWDFGGIFKVGVLVNPTGSCLLDFFIDYQVQPVKFSQSSNPAVVIDNTNLGGFSFGGAIGFEF